ncbi:TPA: Arc family DNA-binding protein [Stenotrophomonas maltophilia]|nr:Arc family DNA-binding protein [Stenotrophomonas maltophilia]
MSKANDPQVKFRLPVELKAWVEQQAAKNRSSMTSEVVRAIRERMERSTGRIAA